MPKKRNNRLGYHTAYTINFYQFLLCCMAYFVKILLKCFKFVITGGVNHFANRNEVKALIESMGGKVTGSVTGKTDFLINKYSLSPSLSSLEDYSEP